MPTTRPFAYNTGSAINGTDQIGDLAIGVDPEDYSKDPGGVKWWNGPNEELGYVIAYSQSNGLHPTQEGASNKLTLNPSYKGTDVNLSNSNQTAHQQFGYQQSVLGVNQIGAAVGLVIDNSGLIALQQSITNVKSNCFRIEKG